VTEIRSIVRQVAREHLEATHPERIEELDVVFDTAYDAATETLPPASRDEPPAVDGGLPFDVSLVDVSVVGLVIFLTLELVQTALLLRERQERSCMEERLEERLQILVERAEVIGPLRKELFDLPERVARAVPAWRPAVPAEPVPVEALQLLVERRDRGGRPLLQFRLRGAKGGRSYGFGSFGERVLEREPEAYFEELYTQVAGSDPEDKEEQKAAERWVRSRGAYLFETFLPERLQAELRELARTGGDLLVISEEPWIPWELLKFPAAADGESRFLGEAFALARWIPGDPPPARLPLRRMAVVRSALGDGGSGGEEAGFLLEQAERGQRRVEPVAARYVALTDAMAQGHHDGWHFIGHGDRSRAGAEWWQIALDDRVMNPQDLSDELAAGFGRQRPFVFLNACRAGGSAPGLVDVGGWPAGFLKVKAGGFLGPLWAIQSDRAAAFARLFYGRLLDGQSIAEAVRGARLELRELFPGDPTWLAYALYADPAAVCPRQEEAVELPAVEMSARNKAWTDKREYKRLAGRLSNATAEEHEALGLRLLRPALGVWDEELVPLGEGLWAVGLEPPYPVVVQVLRFDAPGEDLGAEEVARVRRSAERLRRSAIETGRFLLLHNRHSGSRSFREQANAVLQELVSTGRVPAAELWDYQQLLRRAFGGMLDLLVSVSRWRSLSLATVEEVLGRASWQDDPLKRVPLRTSVLVADQHRLVGEEDAARTVADPAAEALAGQDRSITLLLGAFGFGKTTALARALLEHETEVFYVPAAGISEEVHGAKDLLSRCVDLDRLLEGVPEEDREDYRLLARPVVEYVFKQKEIDAVLVLDGLDESPFLARPGGLQNLVNNLWDLRVPVVLSMRTEFWDDKLQDFEASFGDRAAHGERRVRRLRKVELLEWRDEEIRIFLERFGEKAGDEAERARLRELASWLEDGRFERIYGDIPRRPLFLRLIAETVAAGKVPDRRVGRARLLAEAARVKIRRDVTAPRRAGGAGRPSILGRPMSLANTLELAWQAMVVAAARMTRVADGMLELLPDCPYEAVRDVVPRLQEVDDPLPLFLHSLLRLSEPRTGYRPARVRFAHRAFQEFFLAWHVVETGEEGAAEAPEAVAAWIDDLRREALVGSP
jgi:hypothetical protein